MLSFDQLQLRAQNFKVLLPLHSLFHVDKEALSCDYEDVKVSAVTDRHDFNGMQTFLLTLKQKIFELILGWELNVLLFDWT